jgi:hypothetical protein
MSKKTAIANKTKICKTKYETKKYLPVTECQLKVERKPEQTSPHKATCFLVVACGSKLGQV